MSAARYAILGRGNKARGDVMLGGDGASQAEMEATGGGVGSGGGELDGEGAVLERAGDSGGEVSVIGLGSHGAHNRAFDRRPERRDIIVRFL